MKFLLSLILTFSTVTNIYANENKEILDSIALGKIAGMCGLVKQMATFQNTTQMKGGNEFITRFLNTEATRLGMSLEVFLSGCIKSVDNYTRVIESLEKKD